METDPVSETYFLVFRIPDDGQSPIPNIFFVPDINNEN
jgi:hypothetical protein